MNALTTTVTSLSQLFLTQLPRNLTWLLLGTSLLLFPGCAPNGDISYQVNEQEERIDIFYGDELFTSLQYAEHFKKPILYPLKTGEGIEKRFDIAYPSLKLGLSLISDRGVTIALSTVKKLEQDDYEIGFGVLYDLGRGATIYLGLNNLNISTGLTVNVYNIAISYAVAVDKIDFGYNNLVSVKMLF